MSERVVPPAARRRRRPTKQGVVLSGPGLASGEVTLLVPGELPFGRPAVWAGPSAPIPARCTGTSGPRTT